MFFSSHLNSPSSVSVWCKEIASLPKP